MFTLLSASIYLPCTTNAQMGAAPPEAASPLAQAKEYAANKDYDKAIDIFRKVYEQNPSDASVYQDYLNTLLQAKKYKDAEKLVEGQLSFNPRSSLLFIDLGRVYDAEGKGKKADEQYDLAVQYISGDDMVTQQMANAFTAMGKDDYTLRTYERAKDIIGNPYLYSGQLAKLYAKKGDMDKALDMLMEGGAIQFGGLDNTKTMLLELLGIDTKKMQQAQKALIKKINQQPENTVYPELLTWLYTQKNDWDGALIQMEALDARGNENGRRMIDFARMALKEKQYDIAVKAYDEVIAKGKSSEFYPLAKSERLSAGMLQIENTATYTPQQVADLAKQYEDFLTEFPQYYGSDMVRDYARLEAQYANDPQKAISILNKAIEQPNARRDFVALCKLQMGDYYILVGKIWDASLTYSQVDKDFKQDMLGEDARFRNAKLAYYRGDFNWAQYQLSILKASTSDLIANDALYLSVLITENVGPDSNYVPLLRFAHADLLLFQNKDKEAETLLDSISAAFPKHPLNDDILMLRARIAEKHRDYTKELAWLKQVYEQYGKDVLGDDAVFKMAEVYQNDLHQNDQAKHYYEQLIIDYPGSTYVQSARKRLAELNAGNTPSMP
ncbi:MAG: tetratricopeptide repeat protein [Flavipsychrobacter sp.]